MSDSIASIVNGMNLDLLPLDHFADTSAPALGTNSAPSSSLGTSTTSDGMKFTEAGAAVILAQLAMVNFNAVRDSSRLQSQRSDQQMTELQSKKLLADEMDQIEQKEKQDKANCLEKVFMAIAMALSVVLDVVTAGAASGLTAVLAAVSAVLSALTLVLQETGVLEKIPALNYILLGLTALCSLGTMAGGIAARIGGKVAGDAADAASGASDATAIGGRAAREAAGGASRAADAPMSLRRFILQLAMDDRTYQNARRLRQLENGEGGPAADGAANEASAGGLVGGAGGAKSLMRMVGKIPPMPSTVHSWERWLHQGWWPAGRPWPMVSSRSSSAKSHVRSTTIERSSNC